MMSSKTNSNRDVGYPVSNRISDSLLFKPFHFIQLLITGTVRKLNPFNWFNDFSNIEITIEEDSLKKS